MDELWDSEEMDYGPSDSPLSDRIFIADVTGITQGTTEANESDIPLPKLPEFSDSDFTGSTQGTTQVIGNASPSHQGNDSDDTGSTQGTTQVIGNASSLHLGNDSDDNGSTQGTTEVTPEQVMNKETRGKRKANVPFQEDGTSDEDTPEYHPGQEDESDTPEYHSGQEDKSDTPEYHSGQEVRPNKRRKRSATGQLVGVNDMKSLIMNGKCGIQFQVSKEKHLVLTTSNIEGIFYRITIEFQLNEDTECPDGLRFVRISTLTTEILKHSAEENTEAHQESSNTMVLNSYTIDCMDLDEFECHNRVNITLFPPPDSKAPKRVKGFTHSKSHNFFKYVGMHIDPTAKSNLIKLLESSFRGVKTLENSAIDVGKVVTSVFKDILSQGKSFGNHIGKNLFAFAATLTAVNYITPDTIEVVSALLSRTYSCDSPSKDYADIISDYVKLCKFMGIRTKEGNVKDPAAQYGLGGTKETDRQTLLSKVNLLLKQTDLSQLNPKNQLQDVITQATSSLKAFRKMSKKAKSEEELSQLKVLEDLKNKSKSQVELFFNALRFCFLFKGQKYFTDSISFIGRIIEQDEEIKKLQKDINVETARIEVAQAQIKNLQDQLNSGSTTVAFTKEEKVKLNKENERLQAAVTRLEQDKNEEFAVQAKTQEEIDALELRADEFLKAVEEYQGTIYQNQITSQELESKIKKLEEKNAKLEAEKKETEFQKDLAKQQKELILKTQRTLNQRTLRPRTQQQRST